MGLVTSGRADARRGNLGMQLQTSALFLSSLLSNGDFRISQRGTFEAKADHRISEDLSLPTYTFLFSVDGDRALSGAPHVDPLPTRRRPLVGYAR